MRVERKHTAKRWLENLELRAPWAATLAKKMNKRDNFEWKFKRSSVKSKYRKHVDMLKAKKENETITEAEIAELKEIEKNDPKNKEWKDTDLPYAYAGWENWSGGDDSSTDSDSDGDDDEESEAETEEKPTAVSNVVRDAQYGNFTEGYTPQFKQVE